jgi:hypothetical protein
MQLVVLAVADCPGLRLLDQRLAQVLENRSDVTVAHRIIGDLGEARRWGMQGSPTLLIDGISQFAEADELASMSCRLYRCPHRGRADGAPSIRQLRRAISNPVAVVAGAGDHGWLDALGRAESTRIAPSERGLRAVHQAVLRAFADTGAPPSQDVLEATARPFDSHQVLAELAAGDFLCLNHDGQISAAYPFSATVTPHKIRLSTGTVAYSMCAIDALGISAMLDVPVLIESADPLTGAAVSVFTDPDEARWEPDTAVVYAGQTVGACTGSSATTCCGHINFFTSQATAAAWARAHPDVAGGILSQARALGAGRRIFGQLLR